MASKKPAITEMVQQIVREAATPLSVDEVALRLAAMAPGASKNFKNSVRNSLSNNRLGALVRLPDGRVGWRPFLLNGATQRHIFYDEDLAERELLIGDALADMFMPMGGPASSVGALRLELAGGPQILGRIEGSLSQNRLDAGPQFWDWLEALGASPGDSLIVTVLDADERRYGLRLEPAAARDEAAIALRNAEVLAAAIAFLRRQRGRAVIWDLVANLNASGVFHKPIAPDPFEDMWTEEIYGPVQDEYGVDFPLTGSQSGLLTNVDRLLKGRAPAVDAAKPGEQLTIEVDPEELPPGVSIEEFRAKIKGVYQADELRPLAADDPLLPAIIPIVARSGLPSPTGKPYRASELVALFGSDDATLDWIDEGAALGLVEIDDDFDPEPQPREGPPDLPAAYAPTGAPRKAQPSPQGRKGPVKTYVLRLTMPPSKGFSRDIEIAEDQNLEDLHLTIQKALGWDDDHLYSFFMGRRPYDRATEIGSPWSDSARHTYQVTLGSLGLKAKQKFFYLFDYGDSHLFALQVLKINAQAPKGTYPKIVARAGRAPQQYFGEDDDF